jgi:hypothetical protein
MDDTRAEWAREALVCSGADGVRPDRPWGDWQPVAPAWRRDVLAAVLEPYRAANGG